MPNELRRAIHLFPRAVELFAQRELEAHVTLQPFLTRPARDAHHAPTVRHGRMAEKFVYVARDVAAVLRMYRRIDQRHVVRRVAERTQLRGQLTALGRLVEAARSVEVALHAAQAHHPSVDALKLEWIPEHRLVIHVDAVLRVCPSHIVITAGVEHASGPHIRVVATVEHARIANEVGLDARCRRNAYSIHSSTIRINRYPCPHIINPQKRTPYRYCNHQTLPMK